MGSFYSNISLKTTDYAGAKRFLSQDDIDAFVALAQKEFVCVFPANGASLFDLGAGLSKELSCTCLAVINHDDDVLMYRLFKSGELIDEYNSCPEYFTGVNEGRIGGDADRLCEVFQRGEVRNQLADILSRDYTFEMERHHAIVAILGLPRCTVGSDFNYIVRGDAPLAGIDADTLFQTGSGGSFEQEFPTDDFSPPGNEIFLEPKQKRSQSIVDLLQSPAGIKELLGQAQKRAIEHKGEIDEIEVMGSAGAGVVSVKSRGNLNLISIEIKEQALDPDYVEMLEELVLTALNDAARKTHEEMQKVNQRIISAGFGF